MERISMVLNKLALRKVDIHIRRKKISQKIDLNLVFIKVCFTFAPHLK